MIGVKSRKYIIIFLITFVILLSILWELFLHTPVVKGNDFHYFLKAGTTAKMLANDLHTQANLKHPFLFQLLVKLRGESDKLKAGEYLFASGSLPYNILDQVVSDKILYHPFIIIEGWNYSKIISSLKNNPLIKHTIDDKPPSFVAEKLGIPYKNLEGLLLPDTYYYTRDTTDLHIIKRAYKAMQLHLQKEWEKRDENLPYKTPYDALIVASLIEKEAGVDEERPIVSSVILKRLKKWMPLQIDSAVIYGLADKFKGVLTKKDLHHKSFYNTYLQYGLPPTPIAMPSKMSILAALHPANSDALYFVSKGDGKHEFSTTLKKHYIAVSKYQLSRSKDKTNEE